MEYSTEYSLHAYLSKDVNEFTSFEKTWAVNVMLTPIKDQHTFVTKMFWDQSTKISELVYMCAVDYLDYVLNPINIPGIQFEFKDIIADIMVPLPDQYRSGLSKHIFQAINQSDVKVPQLCNKLKDVVVSFINIKKMLISNTIDSSIKQLTNTLPKRWTPTSKSTENRTIKKTKAAKQRKIWVNKIKSLLFHLNQDKSLALLNKQALLFLKKSIVTNNYLELAKYKYLEIIVGIAVQYAIELDWLSSLI